MRDRWTERGVIAVLYGYRDIAEVLREAPAATARYDDAFSARYGEPYLFALARYKADIELAIGRLPWPRLVPAALHWVGGYSEGQIAALLRRHQANVSRWLDAAERDIVRWLVYGKPPRPPGPRAPVHPMWWVPLVVELLLSGDAGKQVVARALLDEILRGTKKNFVASA